MKYQYGDLVKFTNNYGMHAAQGDEGTVQHVDKFGNILVLVESGEFAARFEEVREEDIELIDRLSDEDLNLLKEELQRMNYKTLLKLDYAYTENQLFDVIEKYKWLFKLNYTIDEIFAVEYKRLQMEDDKHGI